MSQPIEKLAVLFADICGSTALYESLGDDLARKMISRCINTMAGKISGYQGTLIKTIGDEVMVTFPSAEAAFYAACAMLVAVNNDRPLDGIPLHIRIGFNYGEVICKQEDTQNTRFGISAYRKSPDNNDEMILRYRDQSLRVNKERRSVALGRGETCDIVVQNDFASRLHIRIELRFGKFIIADHSINGTYIRFSDGNVVHITREEISLQGNGSISLGQSFAENPAEVVEFSISSTHVQHRDPK